VVDLLRFEWCRNEIKHSISILQTDKANSTRKEFEDAIDMFRESEIGKRLNLKKRKKLCKPYLQKKEMAEWHMT
jgi:hypothetical protein